MSNPLAQLPIVGGMFDSSQDDAINAIKGNKGLWDNLKTPDLQWKDYAPTAYQYGGDMQAQQIENDPLIRSAQMSALQKLSGLADTGLSDVDQAGYENARSIGSQVAHGADQAALQNATSRGVAGSGMEFAMREQGAQDAASRAQQAGLQQAADSARQRALYQKTYGDALSSQRGQDFQQSAANTDILNKFNQANTGRRDQVNQANTAGSNQAQMYNNQGQINTQQQNFNNQLSKTGGQTGANGQVANAYAAENAANTAGRNANTGLAISAIAGMPSGAGGGTKKQLAGTDDLTKYQDMA
jgi:hypothetical protein